MKHDWYDVIVVGGGHAGCEAAHAAARMGVNVALITMSISDLGVMSCNPAIGGLGKGHLVREIDALDGLIGRVADKAAIQFRLLNRKKGPAVQGPRVQADRRFYQANMRAEIDDEQLITIIEGEVGDLLLENGQLSGVVLQDGVRIRGRQVIITSGTFLGGVLFIGEKRISGGRLGAKASTNLSCRIREICQGIGRLKTGTPPRLVGKSIDWASLEMQRGDEVPELFSFLHDKPFVEQVSCGITHTTEQTHDIIRRNLDRSALYGGHINGVGPRYCPSIEDKVVRFTDKASHQIFLEPETIDGDVIYPNGISTSMPEEVQIEYVRSIPGLEQADIIKHGYAIEYDYVDPRSLNSQLEMEDIPGLYLAGQINGTTGYEEAAAQGLVAGLNAASRAKSRGPVVFSRSQSYIGVMIDDLTTIGVSEPYRMFTSRAEYRLTLRADNADARLTGLGISLGCVRSRRAAMFSAKMDSISDCRSTLKMVRVNVADLKNINTVPMTGKATISAYDALASKKISFPDLKRGSEELGKIADSILEQVSRDAVYEVYAERQERDIMALKKNEALSIPASIDFDAVGGLSNEVRARLKIARPKTIAQAQRLEGMTPAAMVSVLSAIRRAERVAG